MRAFHGCGSLADGKAVEAHGSVLGMAAAALLREELLFPRVKPAVATGPAIAAVVAGKVTKDPADVAGD